MAAPIRPFQKHRFFIKITISQYHDIDISYIDIDIAKNAFSMTSLAHCNDIWHIPVKILKYIALIQIPIYVFIPELHDVYKHNHMLGIPAD